MDVSEAELRVRINNKSGSLNDFFKLGEIYHKRGEYQELLNLYSEAYSLSLADEDRALLVYKRGDILDIIGERDEARACYEESSRLLENAKDSLSLLDIKGMNYYNLFLLSDRSGQARAEYAEKAFEAFYLLLNENPDYGEKNMIYSHMADLHYRLNDYGRAIESYRTVLEASANDEEKIWSLAGLATICRDNKDFKMSENYYQKALSVANEKKYFTKIYFEMGIMYLDEGRKFEAYEAFNSALHYLRDDHTLRDNGEYLAELNWHLGMLAYDNSDFDEAIEALMITVRNLDEYNVFYVNAHVMLGHAFHAKGDRRMAEEHYNKALLAPVTSEAEKKLIIEHLRGLETEH